MRGYRSVFLFGGLTLALGLSACAVEPLDPEEEIAEVQASLDDAEDVEAPGAAGVDEEPDPGEGEDPNPVPWREESQNPADAPDDVEPNPIPWRATTLIKPNGN